MSLNPWFVNHLAVDSPKSPTVAIQYRDNGTFNELTRFGNYKTWEVDAIAAQAIVNKLNEYERKQS